MRHTDPVDRWRLAVAILSLVIFIALIAAFSGSKPMPINGDTLGREATESLEDYLGRARQSVDKQVQDNPQLMGYGLVSFTTPLDAQAAGEALAELPRVNAIQLQQRPVIALPEPTVGMSRGKTFAQQLELKNLKHSEIYGAVVWAQYEDMEKLTKNKAVLAVEVLPPDAAWLRFSVKPGGAVNQKYTEQQPTK